MENSGALSKSIHSGKWMAVSMICQRILSFGTFFVMARLLKPEDYGVIAIILMVTAVVDRLTSHGLETALVQGGGEIDRYLDPIWTINLLKSLGLAVVIFFIAGPISVFFNIPQALPLLRLSGLLIIFANLGNVRQIYIFTGLDFKKIFWRDLAGQLSYSVVAITWSIFISASAWALLSGHLSRLLVSALATYALYPSKPRFSFNFLSLKKFFSYSKWVVGQNMLDYFNSLIGQIFIGRFLGAERLGFYSKAADLASVTRASLLSIISKVGFYAYNFVQDDLKKIQDGFIKSLNIMLMLAIPFSFFLLVEGGAIVSVLLGKNWLPLVVPLKVLAVGNIFTAIYGITYPLFNSVGRPDINFKMTMAKLFLSLPLFYFGIEFLETNGAAAADVVISLVLLLYVIWEARKILKLSYKMFLPSIFHISLSMAPAAFLAIFLRPLVHGLGSDYLIFVWVIFLSLLYMASFWLFSRFFSSGPKDTVLVIFAELMASWRS